MSEAPIFAAKIITKNNIWCDWFTTEYLLFSNKRLLQLEIGRPVDSRCE